MSERPDTSKWLPKGLAVSSAVLLACTVLFGACASTGSSAYRLSQVDVQPELQGCPGYSSPVDDRGYRVEVQFVVDETGEVKPGTVVARPRRSLVGEAHTEEMMRRAVEDASECSYTPALLDGQPVPVRMTRSFHYPGEG